MKGNTNLYIGIGFALFAIVQWAEGQVDEFVLYISLAASFMITWFSMKDTIAPKLKRLLVILSWVLIAFCLFWFLYLVRTDSWR